MEEYPKRKRNRLEDFDYSSNGAYFITCCTPNNLRLFWDAASIPQVETCCPGNVPLSNIGKIVEQGILDIPNHYEGVWVDKYCIMPDHIHLILRIESEQDGRQIAAPTISRVVGNMKRWVSLQVGVSVWQKSFHDHCIRNKKDYNEIWEYIEHNPLKYLLGYRRK